MNNDGAMYNPEWPMVISTAEQETYLVFAKAKNFDLLCSRCDSCRYLHIFGFPHQLDGIIEGMTLITECECPKCGNMIRRRDQLEIAADAVYDGAGI